MRRARKQWRVGFTRRVVRRIGWTRAIVVRALALLVAGVVALKAQVTAPVTVSPTPIVIGGAISTEGNFRVPAAIAIGGSLTATGPFVFPEPVTLAGSLTTSGNFVIGSPSKVPLPTSRPAP